MRCLHRKKEPHIVFKIDISKAFDSVSWDFLLEGFGQKCCNLLCLLFSTSSTRMLFLLVMEVLNALITKAAQEKLLQLLAINHAKHRISLYADDVIIFQRTT
ncbi:hypothetical protein U9M48_027496 [Paspalum notatum var. saurae]|uniref:Reverse transcriptase domain-containing protein n=1 Tax=Paspalum notatum var. saurae TaxID=547442 RepID=A0AAQ3X050_PASNO